MHPSDYNVILGGLVKILSLLSVALILASSDPEKETFELRLPPGLYTDLSILWYRERERGNCREKRYL